MENKILQEAKRAQKELDLRRSQLKKKNPEPGTDGMVRGVTQNLSELSKAVSQLNLPDPEIVETYNCEVCGKEINRYYATFLKQFVFPVCRCVTAAEELEEEKRARIKKKNEMEKAFRQNLMNEKLKKARFTTFEIRPGAEMIYRQALSFANEFESRETGLLGFGDPGNGKSHLFVSIHHHLDEKGYVCLFLECQRLFNTIEGAKKFSSTLTINDIINAAIQCDLLTLDELGAGKLTQEEFTDVLFPIINGRQGKLTNYTTNLDLDELREWFAYDKYGKPLDNKGRLIDRILGSCEILHNKATSKRQEDAERRMSGG